MEEAKLFKNGHSQAVRLPRKYRFPGKSVFIRQIGPMVVLIPKRKSWDSLIDACGKFTEDYMSAREQGIQERDLSFG